VPVNDPAGAVKITRIGENNPTKITGIAPNTGHTQNRKDVHVY
jgi:hypothetical protein